MMQQKPHQNLLQISTCIFPRVTRNILQLSLFFVFTFNLSFTSKACSPLTTPTLLGQTVTPTALLLNWQSLTTWACTYSIQVQITCLSTPFGANGPYFYSDTVNKSSPIAENYPTQSISMSALCPGSVYQFRAREVEQGGFVSSNWTSTFTFTTPGTFVPPTLNVSGSNDIICPPQTVNSTLNAGLINACGGPYTYSWTPSTGLNSYTIASPVATVTAPITYSVFVTGGPLGCWTANGSVSIIALNTPPSAGNASASPSIICTGLTTMLVLSSYTGSIQWQSSSSNSGPWTNIPGATSNSFVTSPLTANTCFQALVSSCTATTTSNVFCVTVDQPPVFVPTVIQISCTNTVATANMGNPGTSGTPLSFTWAPAPISQQGSSATYTAPGVVGVVATFSDGCVSGATMVINPTPPPVTFSITNVTGSSSITCSTPTVVLSTISTYTYGSTNFFWSSASFTAGTQTIAVTNPGTYTCIVSDPVTQCAATHTTHIYIDITPPTSSVTPVNQSINCAAGAIATATGIALSPTTNVTHMWYSPANPTNPTSSGGQISIFAPTIFGTNGTNTFVLVNNINGCSTTKTIEVTSTGGSFPTFQLNSSQNFSIGCTSTSLTNVQVLFAQAGSGGVVSYTMLPPGYSGGTSYSTSTSLSTFTINSPGNYTVIVKDNSNFCETRIPVSIIQNTFAPDISAGAITRTLSCFTQSVLLIGNSANSAQGPVDFNWAFQNGVNPGNNPSYTIAVSTNSAAASSSIINVYTLTATEENNACINTTVVTMYQNTRPPLPSIGTVTNALTCSTNSLNLNNASATGILPNTFTTFLPLVSSWKGPTPQLPDSGKSSYAAYTPGTYTMTVQDMNNGCTSSTTTVILDDRVYPVLITNTTVALDCDQSTSGGVKLAVTAQGLTNSQVKVQWTTPIPPPNISGANTLTLTTDGAGEYQLVVTTASNNCSRSILIDVTNGVLNADFTPDKETGYAPLTVNFSNSSSSTSSVSGTSSITSVWSFGNGTTRTTTTNVSTSAVYTAPGSYTVTMFSSKGSCLDTVVKVITVDIPSKLVVPNVFTPNGDNSNDIFFVQAANLTQINIQIFDRWGSKVFDLNSSTGNIAWDGKNQSGHEAPDGTYFYTIKATGKDGQSYDTKGTVSLFR